MGNTFSCVSGKSADDSPKKGKGSRPTAGLPSSPSKPRVVKETEDSITISWDKPVYDGGNKIFGYAVKMGKEGQSGWRKLSADCEECTYHVTGLEPDTTYKFFVQAENDNGLSKPSEISDPIKTLPLKTDVQPVSVVVEAATADGVVAKSDENENDKKEVHVEAGAMLTFGVSAEKYVVKEEVVEEKKSRKSSSASEGRDNLSVDVELKDEVAAEVKEQEEEKKEEAAADVEEKKEEDEKMEITLVKSESKESVKSKSSSSSSSSSSGDEKEKKDKKEKEAKVEILMAATAGVNTEADFNANGSSVGHGTGVLSSFLDSRLYQYSNDSLIDEDNEEDAEVKTKNRVNKNMELHQHDNRYFIEIETVDAVGHTMDNYDENDQYIHTHIPPMEPVDFDCDQSNRLSIISEKSMEDNLSPDAHSKDGSHFVFAKRMEVGGKAEMKSEASVSKIPMLGSKIPSRRQNDVVVLSHVDAEIPQPESKISPPQIKPPTTGKAAQDTGSRIPSLGLSFGVKTSDVDSEQISPKDTERKSSIPMFVSSTNTTASVETKIVPPSSIPRRGSGPKTFLPLKKDSSGDSINQTLSAHNSSSEEIVVESKIPTGIPRRKSLEKPEASTKITPPSTRIATGIPRGTSGIRPPGSFGFQARVDTSS